MLTSDPPRGRPFRRHQALSADQGRGFSLVELIVTLVVLAVLAAVAAPSVTRWLAKYETEAAARQLMSDLETARMLTVTQNTPYRIYFNQAGNQYWMQSQNPATLAWANAGSARQLSTSGNIAYEQGVALSFAAQGDQTIAFTPTGTAPGGITAFLTSAYWQSNVVVANTGRVSLVQIKQF